MKSNSMITRRVFRAACLFSLVVLLTGCADTVTCTQAIQMEPVGFWYGLWHGMITPIAWIVSLFDDDTAIYAIYNNGGWYDFGFIWGIGILGVVREAT
ncbi:MAG: hypothetical protein DRO67_06410 [Candidatus Asgardarchaeum californiense]|nr:MAG: hypothetical protein DRO67_06410 [Candidatus Asgardarchaeum californiense]